MSRINFIHQIRVSWPQIDKLYFDIVKVLLDLFIDNMNVTLVNIFQILKQTQRHIAACHVILENIVYQCNVIVNILVHQATDAAYFLQFQSAFEHTSRFCERV